MNDDDGVFDEENAKPLDELAFDTDEEAAMWLARWDMFAAAALTGLLAYHGGGIAEVEAGAAGEYADAMMRVTPQP